MCTSALAGVHSKFDMCFSLRHGSTVYLCSVCKRYTYLIKLKSHSAWIRLSRSQWLHARLSSIEDDLTFSHEERYLGLFEKYLEWWCKQIHCLIVWAWVQLVASPQPMWFTYTHCHLSKLCQLEIDGKCLWAWFASCHGPLDFLHSKFLAHQLEYDGL